MKDWKLTNRKNQLVFENVAFKGTKIKITIEAPPGIYEKIERVNINFITNLKDEKTAKKRQEIIEV